MPQSINILPPELIFLVGNYSNYSDRVNLSTTNSLFRDLLTPTIFRNIRLTNDVDDIEMISNVVLKFGKYVRKISFSGLFDLPEDPISSDSEDGEDGDKEAHQKQVPDAILKMLAGSDPLLPSIDDISIQFVPGPDEDMENAFWQLTYEPDANNIDYDPLRNLLEETFQAVSSNQQLKSLTLLELIPYRAPIWREKDFHKFLGNIDSFTLSLWGAGNGAGWEANTSEYYRNFCQELSEFFFKHLNSVTFIHLESSESGPLGDGEMHDIRLPLKPHHAPMCQTLELVRCFVAEEVRDFVTSHAKSLQNIRLKDCFAEYEYGWQETTHEPRGWQKFFNEVVKSGPILSTLEIENDLIPLAKGEQFGRGVESAGTQRIRAILTDPSSNRRLFSYVSLDDKYGMTFQSEEMNKERFDDGEDQRTYDELMRIVEANAARR
ncbi:hypothetical protein BT63DRAFT_424365 [Microthyrium microscopicum]|uniref:F-box domain-containing protein n=1 Tax=Microthyrium microscopicum TaxID=703497 RepID=A0A6A6UDN4_9PEZI|nr:hypothetical protein BT63DRAFT_424365 [Microthyrium microscopicum]